jgi:predicted transposase YdaD
MNLSQFKLLERDRDNYEKGFAEGFLEEVGGTKDEAIKKLILKQHERGLSIEYIAEIDEIDIQYVKDVVKNNVSKIND